MEGFLDLALAGQGRVIFVTGEAGSGKTTLIQEFGRRAQELHADLNVAIGNCNAYTGIGDPYLPFREILELLTGDVEPRWVAGAMTRERARQLWYMLPHAMQALLSAGPDLIDTFVPGAALLERARSCTSGEVAWMRRLEELVTRRSSTSRGGRNPQQDDLFEQYTRVLQTLARQGPLILVLDDLQWADLGSIGLLFHLGRQLAGNRILIVGAHRLEDVSIGRDGERHPLDPVVNELQREFGDVMLNLRQARGRDFLEAFLDSEVNDLGSDFREMLDRQTRGHPLFTIELIRGLQERGDLVKDSDGRWVEGPALDWQTLPARVEAVIAERIGRLAQPLRAALRIASVEGEVFTAEVIARLQGSDSREMIGRLSRELDRRHRLIRAQAIERPDGRRLSRYRFRNYLFQKYLYDSLDEVERTYLHEDVGHVLEELYGEQANEIAVQLAWHFQEAGVAKNAAHHLYKAGVKAFRLCAYREGITHLERALELLMTLPDSPERVQQELELQVVLGMAWQGIEGSRFTRSRQAYTRAHELCQQTGETDQLCRVLAEMVESHYVGAEHQTALHLAEQLLELAQRANDSLLIAIGHWYVGFVHFALGHHSDARAALSQTISFYVPEAHHRDFVILRGKDAGVGALAYDACCLWCLGFPDQALERSQEALSLARELGHAYTLADVLCFGGGLLNETRREAASLKECAEELIRLSLETVPGWRGTGTSFRGEALVMIGRIPEGIEHIRQGLAEERSIGAECFAGGKLGTLAGALAKTGQLAEAWDALTEAITLVEETDERYWEAELYRLKAELLIMRRDEAEAEASLRRAIDVARKQGNKSLELRATTDLARLWLNQAKTDEARCVLEVIYGWFTEGFDTPDLKEAKALLDELS